MITHSEGHVMGEAVYAETELDCFHLFMTPQILKHIVDMTNRKIQNKIDNSTREGLIQLKKNNNYVRKITLQDLEAFIGLMYLRGLLGWNNFDAERIFHHQFGHPVFRATMSYNRFRFILANLTFDNLDTRQERWQYDRFAANREIFEDWNKKCAQMIQMDKFGTIDECLYACRNQVAFRQYNKSKPAKYGILIKCVNEVSFPYTHHSAVFAGKPQVIEDGMNPYYTNTVLEVTLNMLRSVGLFSDLRGRNITFDNLYTSIPLAEIMWDQMKCTLVGTLKSNRKGLPKEVVNNYKKRESLSYEVYWREDKPYMTFHSYVVKSKSKGKKNVCILSTMTPILGVTKDDGHKKPAIYKFYDFTKGGTDIVDQRSDKYTTSTKNRRWSIKTWEYMLDVTRVNSQTIHSLNHGLAPSEVRKVNSFKFGWDLGISLIKPLCMERKKCITLRKSVRSLIDGLFPNEEISQHALPGLFGHVDDPQPIEPVRGVNLFPHIAEHDKRVRCHICVQNVKQGTGRKAAWDKLPKWKTHCAMCDLSVCKNHAYNVCNSCSENLTKN